MRNGTTLYIYPGDGLEPELMAYEMTRACPEANYLDRQAATLKWLIEGTALNQEIAQLSDGERQAFRNTQLNQLHVNRTPFSQMTFAAPPPKDKRRTDIWYLQTESVARTICSVTQGKRTRLWRL